MVCLRSGSCDGTVRVWEVSSGECVAVLQGHTDYVINVQFDDDIIASASFDKTVKVPWWLGLAFEYRKTMAYVCSRVPNPLDLYGNE